MRPTHRPLLEVQAPTRRPHQAPLDSRLRWAKSPIRLARPPLDSQLSLPRVSHNRHSRLRLDSQHNHLPLGNLHSNKHPARSGNRHSRHNRQPLDSRRNRQPRPLDSPRPWVRSQAPLVLPLLVNPRSPTPVVPNRRHLANLASSARSQIHLGETPTQGRVLLLLPLTITISLPIPLEEMVMLVQALLRRRQVAMRSPQILSAPLQQQITRRVSLPQTHSGARHRCKTTLRVPLDNHLPHPAQTPLLAVPPQHQLGTLSRLEASKQVAAAAERHRTRSQPHSPMRRRPPTPLAARRPDQPSLRHRLATRTRRAVPSSTLPPRATLA